jgi:hypothetical protein
MDVCLLWVCVLSGRCLCDGPIPGPVESYWLWCVSECDQVDIKTLYTCCEQVGRRGKDFEMIENYYDFVNHLTFSDKTKFHLGGKVNRHTVPIWGTETPHVVTEHEIDKVNVSILRTRICGPFLFAENTVTGTTYPRHADGVAFPTATGTLRQLQFAAKMELRLTSTPEFRTCLNEHPFRLHVPIVRSCWVIDFWRCCFL